MDLVDRVSRIVAFVRADYPTHMPATRYVPLAALSRRRVSNVEIATITSELIMCRRRPLNVVDVGLAITRVTNAMPLLDDIKRVQRRLGAVGCSRGGPTPQSDRAAGAPQAAR
jgi:hypothetical protein